MCSLAPRLTNAATDSRIRIHALSDVTSVTGPPGEFTVTIRHRPRYVDEKCVGCGECAAVCPVTYPNDFDFGVAERTAVSRPFANAVPSTFAVERKGWSPCKTACPVHTSAQGYVALVAKGRYEEAYRVASAPNPVPERLRAHLHARVRDVVHPRQRGGADRHRRHQTLRGRQRRTDASCPQALPVFYEEPVAVVGGGPAGLTAARELAQFGYRGDRVRSPARGRRHAARRHPRVPPAARGAAGRGRPHHRRGRRAQDRHALRHGLHGRLAVRRRLQGRLPGRRSAPEQGAAHRRPRPAGCAARRRVPARAGAW